MRLTAEALCLVSHISQHAFMGSAEEKGEDQGAYSGARSDNFSILSNVSLVIN